MNQRLEKHTSNRIHRFGLRRFKAFNETVFLPIQPLTVLAGLNSSGKSSVIDALLLLKQTLLAEKRVAGQIVLDWDGPFFEVDDFEEMVFDKEFGEADNGFFILSFEIPYQVNDTHRQNKHIKANLPIDVDHFFVRAGFTFVLGGRFDFSEPGSEILLSAFQKSDQKPFLELDIQNKLLSGIVDLRSPTLKKWGDFGKNIDFSYFLPVWEEKENLIVSTEDKERFEIYTVYRDLFQPAIKTIEKELLHNIKYLGPLREAPERGYLMRPVRGDDVGVKGEDTVLLLQRHWQREVDFVELPQDEQQVVAWENLSPATMTLGQAVNESLRWLGMQKLDVEGAPRVVSANFMTLSNEQTWVTMADVGFGVSQILPVLTHGLLSDTDSILILEQPEIHLHPRAQARLAELLIGLARTGRRIIIETHSDHFINRLRRIAAEDLSNQLADLVSIVFVQPPYSGEGARLEPLRVNEEGLIENWPPGFLAETAEDAKAIVKAGIRKRQTAPNQR